MIGPIANKSLADETLASRGTTPAHAASTLFASVGRLADSRQVGCGLRNLEGQRQPRTSNQVFVVVRDASYCEETITAAGPGEGAQAEPAAGVDAPGGSVGGGMYRYVSYYRKHGKGDSRLFGAQMHLRYSRCSSPRWRK